MKDIIIKKEEGVLKGCWSAYYGDRLIVSTISLKAVIKYLNDNLWFIENYLMKGGI